MNTIERSVVSMILTVVGNITIIILAGVFMHSIKIEEQRDCLSSGGFKEVPCP